MTYFKKNLDAIRKCKPELYLQVIGYNAEPVGMISKTTSGDLTLTFSSNDNPGTMAYGFHNPWEDVGVHLETVPPGARGLVVFVGMGLGYGPLLVYQKRPQIGKMVILEPSLDLFVTALQTVDLTLLLSDSRVLVLAGGVDLNQMEQAVARLASLEDTHILRHVPSFKWNASLYESLDHDVFMLLNSLNTAGSTTSAWGDRLVKNRFSNLTMLRHTHWLDTLKDIFKDKPAVLIAAGPSLDRSIPGLRAIQEKCTLIAADAALAPLLNGGVEPHLVTSLDFQDLTFEKLAPFLKTRHRFSLIWDIKVVPSIPKRFPARHHFLSLPEEIPHEWLTESLQIRTMAAPAISVAHVNLSIALIIGANPIVLVGQDLGYTAGGEDHARGTILMGQGLPAKKDTYWVDGLDGNKVATDRGLMSMLKLFEKVIAENPDRIFINASAAGAHIPGSRVLRLNEAANRFMDLPFDATETIDAAVAKTGDLALDRFMNRSRGSLKAIGICMKRLRDLQLLTEKILHELKPLENKRKQVSELGHLPQKVAKHIVRLDKLNRALDREEDLNRQTAEITYHFLSENDHLVKENEQIKTTDGYFPWLRSELERIQKVNDKRLATFASYGQGLKYLVDYLDREGSLLESVERNETDMDSRTRLSGLYLEAENFNLARQVIESLPPKVRQQPVVKLFSGEINLALLDFQKARDCWDSVRMLEPGLAEKIATICQRHAAFWIGLADQHGTPGKDRFLSPRLLSVWLGRVAQILDNGAISSTHLQKLYEDHEQLINDWFEAGKTDWIDTVVQGWEAFEGQFPAMLVIKARRKAETGQLEKAIPLLKQALERVPQQAQWRALCARYLIEAGRFDEGIAQLQQAVAVDSKTALLWEELGDVLMTQGDLSSAAIAYEKCFLALPDHIEALLKIGDCHLAGGKTEAAVAAYEAALKKQPQNTAVRKRVEKFQTIIAERGSR